MSGPRRRNSITSYQCRQFLQTSMDIDLHESRGLARRAGGIFDADVLQLYKANDTGLGGFELPEQLVYCNCVYRKLAKILDRDSVVQRTGCEPRGVSNLVDPLMACNGRNPRSKWSRGRVRVSLGMDGQKCVLSRIFGCCGRKSSRIVAAQPRV